MWVVAGLMAAYRHALRTEDRNSIAVGDGKSQKSFSRERAGTKNGIP
jgi:hypothetical protein